MITHPKEKLCIYRHGKLQGGAGIAAIRPEGRSAVVEAGMERAAQVRNFA